MKNEELISVNEKLSQVVKLQDEKIVAFNTLFVIFLLETGAVQ